MKKLTDEIRKEYLENFGTRCPFCDTESIRGGEWDFGIGEFWQRCYCDDCGERWTDVYRLTGVEQYDN